MAIPQQNLMQGNLEQNALNGGGVNNKQQVSNFMTALHQSGAGNNNSFMNSNPIHPPATQNIVNPNPIASNGFTNPNTSTQNTMIAPAANAPGANVNQSNAPQLGTSTFAAGNTQNAPTNIQGSNAGPVQNAPMNTLGSNLSALVSNNQPNSLATPVAMNPFAKGNQALQDYVRNNPNTSMDALKIPTTSPTVNPAPNVNTTGMIDANGNPLAQAPSIATPVAQNPAMQANSALTNYINNNNSLGSLQLATPASSGLKLVSDENLKTNISSANNQVNDFLNKINAHNYEYKDKQDGEGTFTSPMAQELEATELGKQAVINTPRGKMVDYARLGGVNLAAVSVVHREQQKLQAQMEQLRKAFNTKSVINKSMKDK